jgi:hypothetical protein
MVADRASPPTRPTPNNAGAVMAAPANRDLRPEFDRLTVGKLIDHGPARHEFNPQGHPSYYVKILTSDGARTVWGKGLETAFQRSRTQPQIDDLIGIRENNLDPVSFVTRTRNRDGIVIASSKLDTPRPQWVVEKLEDFDLRAAAARALRDPTISRRDAVLSHRELAGAFWILDTAQKHASEKWPQHPQPQQRFLQELRETLALTIERGIEVPPPKPVQEAARTAAASQVRTHGVPRTRE